MRVRGQLAVFAILVLSQSGWAAKPGPKADTSPPAPLLGTSGSPLLDAVPAVRGLLVPFLASGDDGTSGTASAYDFRLDDAPCSSGGIESLTWTTAPNQPIAPFVAGSSDRRVDGIDFSPLASGSDYCIQIRVRDDVNNAWTSPPIDGHTPPGDWSVNQLPLGSLGWWFAWNMDGVAAGNGTDEILLAILPRSQAGSTLGVAVLRTLPGTEDRTITPAAADCLDIAGDCLVQILLGDSLLQGLTALSHLYMPAIALTDGVVGVVVVGTGASGSLQAVLLERREGQWTSELLQHPPIEGSGERTAFTYTDAGSPVYTWVRADSSDSSTLMLSERVGLSWVDTELVTHIRPARRSPIPGFRNRALVQDPSGPLRLFVAPNGGLNGVILARGAAIADCSSEWTHGLTPQLEAGAWGWAVALDATGRLAVAGESLAGSDIAIVTGREGDHFSGPYCGPLLGSAGNMVDGSLSWTQLTSDVPESWLGAWAPRGPKGITDSACGLQIGLDINDGAGAGFEQQVVNVQGSAVVTQRIDHAQGVGNSDALLTLPGGDLVSVYENAANPERVLTIARGPSCPGY